MNRTTHRRQRQRRSIVTGAAAAALTWLAAPGVRAQALPYPSRPVRLLGAGTPGGVTDIAMRLLSDRMSLELGQPVVPDPRPGAGGMLAASAVVQSPPDGYALLMTVTSLIQQPSLYSKLPYDPFKDLAPIVKVASTPLVMVVPASSRAASLRQFIDMAKAAPKPLTYGSSGPGTTPHLYGEVLATQAHIKLVHVPYKGETPCINDVLAGLIDASFITQPGALSYVRAGKMKALAMTGTHRTATFPDVPTFQEAGIAGFETEGWLGMLAPAGTPGAIVERLAKAADAALRDKAVQDRFEAIGLNVRGGTPQDFADALRADHAVWRKIILQANVKLD